MLRLTERQKKPCYSEAVVMVHDEFNSAGEKLYQEALQIINATKILNEEKVKRLKALGFTATREVVDAESVLSERKLNEEIVRRIDHYRQAYPLNKFITEEQVASICGKYGLIYGDITQYTGFVPEKNMIEIERFMKQGGLVLHGAFYPIPGGRFSFGARNWELIKNVDKDEDVSPSTDGWSGCRKFSYKPTLLIAAPQKDFKISESQEINGFAIKNKPVPDPVVLAPIVGGYLIVTAWGDEASDPLVQNELNN